MSHLYHDEGVPSPGRRVMLATTVYDTPAPGYTYAMSMSREKMHQAGIQTEYVLLTGNCHVDDARNVVVQEFLLSQCEELIFIDGDVYWEAQDLVTLCGFDADLVGGVYPYRRENKKTDGRMPVGLMEGAHDPDENGLLEVSHLPTGFMRIQRHVIETLVKECDHYPNPVETRSKTPILFQRTFIDNVRWGGDVHFCNTWRATGGKILVACELRLGHSGSSVIHDSLGAWLRREKGQTLKFMVAEIQAGRCPIELFTETRRYVGNEIFATAEGGLSLCALQKADGPIIEAGSGLSTIVLAAAHPKQTVWCLEHDPLWALKTKQLAAEAGVFNIAICHQKFDKGWYDLTDLHELPEQFSLGYNDGPPRHLGCSRMGFFMAFGKRTDNIICDDLDDRWYRQEVEKWGRENSRKVEYVDERVALIRRHK